MEVVQLPPEVVLGDPRAAHVVAQHHRDILLQRRLGAVDDALEHHVAVVLLHLRGVGDGPVKQRIGQGRGDGGTQKRPPLPEQPQDIRIGLGAVLNGIHAVLQCHPHALR